jgi:hypothetical protein
LAKSGCTYCCHKNEQKYVEGIIFHGIIDFIKINMKKSCQLLQALGRDNWHDVSSKQLPGRDFRPGRFEVSFTGFVQ